MSLDPPDWSDPDSLAGELRELLRQVDPVPAQVLDAARVSYGWRTLEAELAQLTEDSLLAGAGTELRGEPARLLTFQAGERTIELEVSDLGGGRLRVLGQLVPPQPARVRVDQPGPDQSGGPVEAQRGGPVEVTADSLGRFTFRELPLGPTRFACQPLGPDGEPVGAEVLSEWLVF